MLPSRRVPPRLKLRSEVGFGPLAKLFLICRPFSFRRSRKVLLILVTVNLYSAVTVMKSGTQATVVIVLPSDCDSSFLLQSGSNQRYTRECFKQIDKIFYNISLASVPKPREHSTHDPNV